MKYLPWFTIKRFLGGVIILKTTNYDLYIFTNYPRNLTSITSPAAGASVKVRVTVDTEYVVVGICTTPFSMINAPAVVVLESNVNTVVDPSPFSV